LYNPQQTTKVLGQLRVEFGQAAAGFKTILQQRTNIILKESADRKRNVCGAQEDIPMFGLSNRPPVYQLGYRRSPELMGWLLKNIVKASVILELFH
jgi:hypothetical protein